MNAKDQDNSQDDFDDRPSKTELKREMSRLQDIGAELVKLPNKALAEITLDEELADAIALARRLKSREAQRRQIQYIGKLMRQIDVTPIADYLERRAGGHQEKVRQFHALESLRDTLVEGPDSHIEACMARYPGADRSRLRTLVRTARKERDASKTPKAARKLFKYLQELEAEHP